MWTPGFQLFYKIKHWDRAFLFRNYQLQSVSTFSTFHLQVNVDNVMETYSLVSVVISINVEYGKNKDIHLVEQARHLSVTAIGGQSLQITGKNMNTYLPLCSTV